ncbi:MAG: hypothetical protein U0V74_04570 [Chitinophagales bacterium]
MNYTLSFVFLLVCFQLFAQEDVSFTVHKQTTKQYSNIITYSRNDSRYLNKADFQFAKIDTQLFYVERDRSFKNVPDTVFAPKGKLKVAFENRNGIYTLLRYDSTRGKLSYAIAPLKPGKTFTLAPDWKWALMTGYKLKQGHISCIDTNAVYRINDTELQCYKLLHSYRLHGKTVSDERDTIYIEKQTLLVVAEKDYSHLLREGAFNYKPGSRDNNAAQQNRKTIRLKETRSILTALNWFW